MHYTASKKIEKVVIFRRHWRENGRKRRLFWTYNIRLDIESWFGSIESILLKKESNMNWDFYTIFFLRTLWYASSLSVICRIIKEMWSTFGSSSKKNRNSCWNEDRSLFYSLYCQAICGVPFPFLLTSFF